MKKVRKIVCLFALNLLFLLSNVFGQGVGINQSSPARMFEVLDNTAAQLRLTYTNASVYSDFQTDASGYLIIDPTGNRLGLETTSPISTLHVSGKGTFGSAFAPVAGNGNNILNLLVGSSTSGGTNGIAFWESTTPFGMKLGYDGSGSGANNKLVIYSDTDTELLCFENGGDVGMGVVNPTAKVHVRRTSNGKILELDADNLNIDFRMGHNNGTYGYYWRYAGTGTGDANYLQLYSENGSGTDYQVLNIGHQTSGMDIYGGYSSTGVTIQQNGDILTSGNMGIGTSAPSYKLEVCGTIGTTAASVTTSITCSSDERYKYEIHTINNALSKVMNLRGVYYNWRIKEFPEKHFNEGVQIGVIAQEIEKIYPELVVTQPDGYKSVDYVKIAPILIEAIKEQQEEINRLKAVNDGLGVKLDKLETILLNITNDDTLLKVEKSK